MSINEKQSLFSHLRELQAAAGLATRDDDHTIICPLCWQNYALENVSLEHVVPKKVGGRRVTLTCTTCNNNLGADVDAHLSKFQALRDAQQGFGTVRTTMDINGNLMVANLQLKDRNFIVVGKATDPKAIAAIKEDFAAGNVSDVRFTMFYEYAKNNFQTAVLRAAYLSLFNEVGYQYVKHDVVQAIRRRICDLSIALPNLDNLVVRLGAQRMPYDAPYYIIRRNVDSIECLLVIIRVRKATTTYLGCWMPCTTHPIEHFDRLMQAHKAAHDGQRITIAAADFVA